VFREEQTNTRVTKRVLKYKELLMVYIRRWRSQAKTVWALLWGKKKKLGLVAPTIQGEIGGWLPQN